ncbi:MAG: hypothetical protein PVI43_05925 [Candidatus Bathyarchaeota archaeon]
MKRHVQVLIVLLISLSAIVSIVLINQGNKNRQIYLQAAKWMEGVSPDDYLEVSTLPINYEIIALAREAAHSGPILISESSSIREWANEIIEESPFNSVDIKVSENEYYLIDFWYN